MDDAPHALALVDELPAKVLVAETAYDGDPIRGAIADKRALVAIHDKSVTRQEASARHRPMRPATARRMLHQKTRAVQTGRHSLLQDRQEFPGRRHDRGFRLWCA